MQFASLTAFGEVRAAGVTTDYMSLRDGRPGTQGWTTHSITPGPLQELSAIDLILGALDPRYMGEFSPDLSRGVFLSNTTLPIGTSDSAVTPNLYLRSDLRTPGAGSYTLLSGCPVCTDPRPGNPLDQPALAGASSDFRHVIFESTDSLTSDSPVCEPGTCPVQLYEWNDGTVQLVGILPSSEGGGAAPSSQAGQGALSTPGASHAYAATAISQDGSRIFFTVPGSANPRDGQLYMRQDHSITVKVNASERTTPDPSLDARFWVATPDGGRAFFTTRENLSDSDTSSGSVDDLYMYTVDAPSNAHLTLLSASVEGVSGVVGVSDDGSYVYFVANDGIQNRMFVWHNGTVHLIASVPFGQLDKFVYTAWIPLFRKTSRVSPDGTNMVFQATGVDPNPHSGVGDACSGGCQEVFVYDATANGGNGELVCASCHPGGPNIPSQTDASFISTLGFSNASSHLNRPLSDDGRYVFFDTGDRLTLDDNNAVRDVYEYDTQTHTTKLLSSGAVDSPGSIFADASSSGRDAFFVTRDKLVGWDNDSNTDVYDARIHGGFPEPRALSTACAGDVCRGPLRVAPVEPSPASSTFTGRGNIKMALKRRCAKKHIRRRSHGHLRCVKRRHRGRHRPSGTRAADGQKGGKS